MADIYVDSAGSNTSPYDTWAKAATTLAAAAAIDASGDTIWVKNTHSESTAGAVTLDWAGTAASPTRVICVSDSGEPPTTVATGAVVETTGANNLTVSSSSDYVYFYGIRFKAGDSTNAADVISAGFCTFESCAFELAGNNTGSDFTFAEQSRVVNCTFKSVNTGSSVSTSGANVVFENCSIEAGGTPGAPFFSIVGGDNCFVSGFDFTNLAAGTSLNGTTAAPVVFVARNCKLPASWSGSVNSSTPGPSSIFELHNSDATDTNYRYQKKTQFGIIDSETTLVRTGGASDGTTTLSWKMATNANAEWNHQTLDSSEIVRWNETTGSAITATIEILHDSVTALTDKEIWVEVQYLGTSGFPLASKISDAAATYLTAAANQTTSSETWTTTGMSNANKQKLAVTFTPQEKGFIHATVKVAKASYTVYVDPKLVIT